MELPCPDSQILEQPSLLQRPPPLGDSAPSFPPPRDPLPSFSSLPRKSRSSKSRDRWRGSRATANSDWERLEVSSRYSELSSSTAHSTHSRPSQGKHRQRPRRKPRKRSEVLLSGSSTPRHRHDPIMEVSSSRVEDDDDGPQPAPLPRPSSTSSSSEDEAPPVLPVTSPLLPPSPAPSSPSPAPSSVNIFHPTSRDLDLANKETCV